AGLSDPLSLEAIDNGGFDGCYPVLNHYVDVEGVPTPTQPYDSSPWQWWDEAEAQAYDALNGTSIWATQMTLNPDMGPTEAGMWIDVIQGYTAPRLALAMGLVAAGPGCIDTDACNFNALATSDDGSCTYADPGYNCDGESLNIEGCTSAIACNFNEAATIDDGSCDYHEGTDIPTGADVVWLVGLTLTGTPYEALAGGCEMTGGVNPDVSINGVIVGDGSTPLGMAGITDPTGLLGELAALASTVEFSICGSDMTVAALGNNIPMVGNGTFWMSPIPVASDATTGAGQYLWAAPMMNFPLGCGQPGSCNYVACQLSVGCVWPGCTDASADNYDAAAGCDDGSCTFTGCTNAGATNYNADAGTDDGSCLFLVTLSVDMSEVAVSASGVHIAGEFQGWDPAATEASGDGCGGVYDYQIALPNGTHEFKFVNGDAWGDDEYVNGSCSNGSGNRSITVADAAADNGTPCFTSCDACSNPLTILGCTYDAASNYDPCANDDDGNCIGFGSACEGDLNDDGTVGVGDLLSFLGIFGTDCE
ncbi:MAG: hypothetical protein P8M07_03980, partial [Flavobacteriales bacterium]|nr:hypothetical protein [Flavobacteriales bacterium]